jgi:hypothetical protein
MIRLVLTGWAFALLTLPLPAQDAPAKKEVEPSAAEKVVQVLHEKRDIDIKNQPLTKVVESLTSVTGVPFEIDPILTTWWMPGNTPISISLRTSKTSLNGALARALQPWSMSYVVLGDHVLLTTSDRAIALQMTQKVNGAIKDMPLHKALEEVSRTFAVNITIDQQVAKEAEKPVSMKLTGAGLEAAVNILAASAGLHVVRLDNALFVTTPAKAKDLPREMMTMPPPPTVQGGVGLGGALGALGGGALGQGGALGGGAFGQIGAMGLGGGRGALGFGGGPPPKPAPPVKKESDDKKSSSLPSRHALIHLLKAAPLPEKTKPTEDSPAQKVRKDLNSAVTIEFASLPLPQAINQLKDKTGIDLVLDRSVLEPFFLERNPNGTGLDGVTVTAKLNKTPIRRGLRNLLSEYDLGYVIVGEQVLITTQAMTTTRQIRQMVTVDVEKTPLADALRKLARETAVNMVLDSRIGKEGQEKVNLQLDEVALDTAVKLLVEQAGLKVVFVDNVIFVTTKARAMEMREDPDFKPRDMGDGPGGGGKVVPAGPPGGIGPMIFPPGILPPMAGGAPAKEAPADKTDPPMKPR